MEAADLEPVKHEKKKRKEKVANVSVETGLVADDLDSSVAEEQENLSGDRKKKAASKEVVEAEKYHVCKGAGEGVKDAKSKRKRGMFIDTKNAESSDSTNLKADKWISITKDGRMRDEADHSGLHESKKRKKKLEDTGFETENDGNKKRKKDRKDNVNRDVEHVLEEIPERAVGNAGRSTEQEREVSKGGSDEIHSLLEARHEKKKRKKEKKELVQRVKLSSEGISDDMINGKNKFKLNAKKTSENKTCKETSRVGNEKKTNSSMISDTKEKPKRVSFSSHVEVFPSANGANQKEDNSEMELVQGKRFSAEEDEMVKQAVIDYIDENHLGEEGLKMVLNCRSYPQIRGCWKEIGAALPWRPYTAVYTRAHVLFQRSEERKWEPEELEIIRRHYEENGPKWKQLADILGKHRFHVKDAWRRNKLPNLKKGHWSQEEYQTLFDLVNKDLRMKAFEEKKTKHGMLRENISWEAISTMMSTRHMAVCCQKWYDQLTSPLVNQGLWDDADDYRLLDVLLKLDACCVEDVDWDNLLENRSGGICQRRWNQMIKHIGGHRERSFMEQVEVLSARYCPDMLEYRTGEIKEL